MTELQDSSVKFLLMFMAAMEKSVPAPEQIIEKEKVHLIVNGENNLIRKEKEDSHNETEMIYNK
jgi:hypothetical protein